MRCAGCRRAADPRQRPCANGSGSPRARADARGPACRNGIAVVTTRWWRRGVAALRRGHRRRRLHPGRVAGLSDREARQGAGVPARAALSRVGSQSGSRPTVRRRDWRVRRCGQPARADRLAGTTASTRATT